MKRIVIFASGSGSNAQNIIKHFQNKGLAKVVHLLSNKKDAKVLDKAKQLNVDYTTFTKDELNSDVILNLLKGQQPDLIVLAGFLLKFPEHIIKEFNNRVINIHPALLPKYGGKGMYGKYVHKAVIDNKEIESGITIHYVNEHYDEGAIIFQASTALNSNDTPDTLATKIHQLEAKHFPNVIEQLLLN